MWRTGVILSAVLPKGWESFYVTGSDSRPEGGLTLLLTLPRDASGPLMLMFICSPFWVSLFRRCVSGGSRRLLLSCFGARGVDYFSAMASERGSPAWALALQSVARISIVSGVTWRQHRRAFQGAYKSPTLCPRAAD